MYSYMWIYIHTQKKRQISFRILILEQSIVFCSFITKIYLSLLLKVDFVRAFLTFESTSFTFGHSFLIILIICYTLFLTYSPGVFAGWWHHSNTNYSWCWSFRLDYRYSDCLRNWQKKKLCRISDSVILNPYVISVIK